VVRTIMRVPSSPVPLGKPGRGVEAVISESVDRWLGMLERNRGTWLAALGARGLGRDPEVEEILEEAREEAATLLVEAVHSAQPSAEITPHLRAAVRAYGGFAEAASVEWLERGRLTREQAQVLLVQGFLSIVREVVPAMEQMPEAPGRTAA
jgi:hypothetical protein